MKNHILSGIAFGLLVFNLAYSDQEASNVSHVSISEGGRCYAKSIPDSISGDAGVTKVYDLFMKEEKLIGTFNWYSHRIYLHCGLGKGDKWGFSVVRFGPWPRGEYPDKHTLALAFYLSDTLVKSYSTLEIAGSKDNRTVSISHYSVINKVLGYRWVGSNEYVFEIVTSDNNVISFEPTSGKVLSRRKFESSVVGACKN